MVNLPDNVHDKIEQHKQNTETIASLVSQEFHNFIADVETLVKSLTSLTGEELDSAKAQLSERIAVAEATVQRLRGTITEQACNTFAATDNYVREKPWSAVGISAAAGLLLGLALSRRH